MEKELFVCNECDRMHEDEIYHCETCGSERIRIVLESELLAGMQRAEEGA